MQKLLYNAAAVVTVNTNGKGFKAGKELNDISVLNNYSILIENDKIKDLLPNSKADKLNPDEIIDVTGKTILPGLVDCHTHTLYAGSRADEFRQKIAGVGYEEIAEQGGGINATVNAIRNTTHDELYNLTKPRVDYFVEQGVTTLEIKSGYGLSYYDEIKILQVIKELNKKSELTIVPTFLGAHTFPPEYKNEPEKYIDIIVNEMLPYVAKNNLAEFCDAFCEKTAFTAEQTDRIFTKAAALGLKIKLHTDQFNNVGGIEVAAKHNALSVDHLEVFNEADISTLKEKNMVCVLLPGVSFFLRYGYAPARKLIDNGLTVALSTDYNPGSSHIANLNLVMSLAALNMGMTVEETISAVTINAAKALGLSDKVGSIEVGKNADFAIFDTDNFADILYQVGKNLNVITIKDGNVIYKK